MKTLSTITLFLASAGMTFAINVDDPTPSVLGDDVTIQTFTQELGNYSATDFNNDANTMLTNFDASASTGGSGFVPSEVINGVLYTAGTSGVNFRVNFDLLTAGFGRLVSDDVNFVSSSPNSLVWGGVTGTGAAISFPEFVFGSVVSEEIYGVGFTVTRLQSTADVRVYSDIAGTNQIGSTVTLSANNPGDNYSFFGYAGDTVIRRVEVEVASGIQFGIDDFIVTTTQIPEPAEQAMFLGGVIAGLVLLSRRFRKNKA
ncbi:hypothetical protein [Rubellicoccus peritrichatus]|uniref:PEP-CTERM protein-sorting domain-containing protein n=1 Tax=Rubellicoccus peritrichatus TaxID=3080537 RepID=A0AAQ3LCH3_9BACT|nr:hypothetical protein [Puniceicoccus sp. CR14]WOO41917.1 hypothetical protein RZN69_02370 [Puniceicoccus sp. CR14]